jgi:hypothetical protein
MDPRTPEQVNSQSVNQDAVRSHELYPPAPDVDSDRVPATDAEPEGSIDSVDAAPLGIQEIEDLEDDAKGG